MRQTTSFGPFTREQFEALVAAPYGRGAQKALDLQWDRARGDLDALTQLRLTKIRGEMIVDEGYIEAEAADLVDDLLLVLDEMGLLADGVLIR